MDAALRLLTGERQQEAGARIVPGVDVPRQDWVLNDDEDRAALPYLQAISTFLFISL